MSAALGAVRQKCAIPGAGLAHVWDGDDLRDALTGAGSGGGRKRLSLAGRLAVLAGRAAGISDDPAKLRRASRAYMPVGRRVAIIGGGLVGAELAECLVERGREVAVLEEGPIIALEMAHPRRWRVLHDLREAGVRLETNTRVREITKAAVHAEQAASERVLEIGADSVIIATGLVANPDPIEAFRGTGVPVVVVGDANGVGYIEGAIHEGFRAAIEL